MLACNSRETWTDFLQFVKTKCSVTAFGNWLAPIRVVEATDEEITLEVPNIFVQEYLLSNYKKELCAFLPVDRFGEPSIKFIIAPPPVRKTTTPIITQPVAPVIQNDKTPGYSDLKLNNQYRFESFIEGPTNQFVKSAAMAVAEQPGQIYNPLIIYGDVGRGKTHLLHSIGHHIRENNKKLRVQCITTEAFINDLVDCLRNKSIDKMKYFYRKEIDVLLFDDFQFLQFRRNFEEEFVYTIECLKNKGAQVVITSDKPPSLLKLSERMIGKMTGGIFGHIGEPDLETRVAILHEKARQKGMQIPNEVAFYIAEHIHSNVRQLEGAVNRLSAYSRLMNLNITEELVSKALKEMLHHAPQEKVSVEQILKCVASAFQVKVSDLRGSTRTKNIVLPRQIAMYLAVEMINESLNMLGISFGGKTHSTILHAKKTIAEKMKTDTELYRQVGAIRQNIHI
ncbi:MAG: chromosomal replication initiator protein DnaA [Parachlamydiaceae bacterium]|nr:chromosomal replication initiator protein DnaA [Parachlamydiaceae bacterium]